MQFSIRNYEEGDEKDLQRSINDMTIYQNTLRIPHPYTLQMARSWIKKNKRSKKTFAIIVDGKAAGGIGYHGFRKDSAELGYWLSRKHWNKGIMTKAVKMMLRYGNELGLKRIRSSAFEWNRASQRVLEKNGFRFIRKSTIKKKGKNIKCRIFAKIIS